MRTALPSLLTPLRQRAMVLIGLSSSFKPIYPTQCFKPLGSAILFMGSALSDPTPECELSVSRVVISRHSWSWSELWESHTLCRPFCPCCAVPKLCACCLASPCCLDTLTIFTSSLRAGSASTSISRDTVINTAIMALRVNQARFLNFFRLRMFVFLHQGLIPFRLDISSPESQIAVWQKMIQEKV